MIKGYYALLMSFLCRVVSFDVHGWRTVFHYHGRSGRKDGS